MSEYSEHNPDDHEDPAPGPTWLIGFIGAAILVVTVLGVTAMFFGAEDRHEVVEANEIELLDLETIRREQMKQMEGDPHWLVTREDGRVVSRKLIIPIEAAMERIAEEQGP